MIHKIIIIFSTLILTGCLQNNNNMPLIEYSYEKPALKIVKIADKTENRKMYNLAKLNLKLAKEKSTIKKSILLMKLNKLASQEKKN